MSAFTSMHMIDGTVILFEKLDKFYDLINLSSMPVTQAQHIEHSCFTERDWLKIDPNSSRPIIGRIAL